MGRGGTGEGRQAVPAGQESSGGQVRSGGDLSLFGVWISGVVRASGVRRQITPNSQISVWVVGCSEFLLGHRAGPGAHRSLDESKRFADWHEWFAQFQDTNS